MDVDDWKTRLYDTSNAIEIAAYNQHDPNSSGTSLLTEVIREPQAQRPAQFAELCETRCIGYQRA